MTETSASRAYQHLRSKLISGEFEPGTRLLYGPIGKEIGVSATPVREAVGQLANEGLVELVPQLGAVVRKMSRSELCELYEMREAIEPFAAAKAAERATSMHLKAITEQVECMRTLGEQLKNSRSTYAGKRLTTQFEKADFAFHMLIFEATGNQTMVRTAALSHVLTRVFGVRRHRYDYPVMQSTYADHANILHALKRGDAKSAHDSALSHIQHGLQTTLNALDELGEHWWEKS